MAQKSTTYLYLRTDADHDVSADAAAFSLDGTTWSTADVTYIAPGARTTRQIAVDKANPPEDGFVGYWWRVYVGPGTPFDPLTNGMPFYGRLTDNPGTLYFEWTLFIPDGS